MYRLILIAAAIQACLGFGAMACDGQPGDVIFEDSFPDDSGGWDLYGDTTKVTPPNFDVMLSSQTTWTSSQNLTFNAVDADYCADVAIPKPPEKDILAQAGIEFWATDYNNFYLAEVQSDGLIGLYRRQNSNWQTVIEVPASPAVKTEPGAVNSIRVIAKAGKIQLMVNGTNIKAVRAQVPQAPLRFGVYAGLTKAPQQAVTVSFKQFEVTSGG
jgi:hypothetical protein